MPDTNGLVSFFYKKEIDMEDPGARPALREILDTLELRAEPEDPRQALRAFLEWPSAHGGSDEDIARAAAWKTVCQKTASDVATQKLILNRASADLLEAAEAVLDEERQKHREQFPDREWVRMDPGPGIEDAKQQLCSWLARTARVDRAEGLSDPAFVSLWPLVLRHTAAAGKENQAAGLVQFLNQKSVRDIFDNPRFNLPSFRAVGEIWVGFIDEEIQRSSAFGNSAWDAAQFKPALARKWGDQFFSLGAHRGWGLAPAQLARAKKILSSGRRINSTTASMATAIPEIARDLELQNHLLENCSHHDIIGRLMKHAAGRGWASLLERACTRSHEVENLEAVLNECGDRNVAGLETVDLHPALNHHDEKIRVAGQRLLGMTSPSIMSAVPVASHGRTPRISSRGMD